MLLAATTTCSLAPPTGVRSLRFATVPARPIPVNLTTVRYDPDRQLSVDPTGTPVLGKHSTGATSTRTSDGHKSMDSDTDHTED